MGRSRLQGAMDPVVLGDPRLLLARNREGPAVQADVAHRLDFYTL